MTDLTVIQDLQHLFDREIDNFFLKDENEIVIWLADGTKVKITTKNVA